MRQLWEQLEEQIQIAFLQSGYDKKYGKVVVSGRPDLCEYQCNGAMAAAKAYGKAPIEIAKEVTQQLQGCELLEEAQAVAPGFINLKVDGQFLATYGMQMSLEEKLGIEEVKQPETILLDYGGPNVAKPLHVGHLRSAIIGESVKRIAGYLGHRVIGDIHMGDWGYQMGLIITELRKRQGDLPYFLEEAVEEYPAQAPFTLEELEEIYPTASARAKEEEDYREQALQATFLLQNGHAGYRALWKHIMNISVADLKKNYERLHVSFELWNGESDVQSYIPSMVERLRKQGFARYDDGALVVDVKEEGDTKEIPPCMILKSDGAALYGTTDLATLLQREQDYHPHRVIYVVDKRQELHFVQVFRCAKKTGIIREETKLEFLGFGTMNGKDGKPFKTREGGVMRLETLMAQIQEEMYRKLLENQKVSHENAKETADIIGLAALKYADLSNQASKDYIFDPERFTSFEGNTGPYILYSIVRVRSILRKYQEQTGKAPKADKLLAPITEIEKQLLLKAVRFQDVVRLAYEESAPHKICAYLYDLANTCNKFYHETPVLSQEDTKRKDSYIGLLFLVERVLQTCITLLGFEAPDRM